MNGLLIAALTTASSHAPIGSGSEVLLCLPCGALPGATGANGAARCSASGSGSDGYRQSGLDMRLNQPQDRRPPLRAPIY